MRRPCKRSVVDAHSNHQMQIPQHSNHDKRTDVVDMDDDDDTVEETLHVAMR